MNTQPNGSGNQPLISRQDGDEPVTSEVLPYVANTPATTEHMPTPTSSWIASLSYDSTSFRLTVHTKSGAEFQHLMVYPNQWTEMKLFPSVGSYYSKNIKGIHAIVHVKRIPKLDDFPKNHGGHRHVEDRFKSPTNHRYKKGRYE